MNSIDEDNFLFTRQEIMRYLATLEKDKLSTLEFCVLRAEVETVLFLFYKNNHNVQEGAKLEICEGQLKI